MRYFYKQLIIEVLGSRFLFVMLLCGLGNRWKLEVVGLHADPFGLFPVLILVAHVERETAVIEIVILRLGTIFMDIKLFLL